MQQGMPQFSDKPLLGPLPPQSRQQRPRQGGQHSAQSKADGKRDVSQRVLCPPERYISVPTTDLQEAFRGVLHYRWNPYTRSAEHHWLTRTLIPGQFSSEDFERFTDICKLFEANSRLDFITVSRCLSVSQLYPCVCSSLCCWPACRTQHVMTVLQTRARQLPPVFCGS